MLVVPVRAAVLWSGMLLGGVTVAVVAPAVGAWGAVPVVGSAASWTWWFAPGVVLPLAFVRSGLRSAVRTAGFLGVLFGLTLLVFGWNDEAEASVALLLWWPVGVIVGLAMLARDRFGPVEPDDRPEAETAPRPDPVGGVVIVVGELVVFGVLFVWWAESGQESDDVVDVPFEVERKFVDEVFGTTYVTPAVAVEVAGRIGLDDPEATTAGSGDAGQVTVKGVRDGVCVRLTVARDGSSRGATGVPAVDGRCP